MGKKKDKHRKHADGHRSAAPLAGLAAMAVQQLNSPAARAAMATGLRAAADALSRPVPPAPPRPASSADAAPRQATGSAEPHPIGDVFGQAAEQLLARVFRPKV